MIRKIMICLLLTTATSVYAGAKDDFIKAVMSQCSKSEADAKALATPGRSGNVIKLKTCTSATIEISDCKLKCNDASSAIGGK